jgi:hypothetical protein
MSLLDTASLIVTPNGYKAGTLYSVIPNTTLGDLSVTRATTATRVNSAGLIESVASNVPRLDYTNGECPSILVEPQRTNLLTYSQDFSNSDWTKINASITANSTISPDGTTNADTISSVLALDSSVTEIETIATNTTYSFSVYIKKDNNESRFPEIVLRTDGVSYVEQYVQLNTKTGATVVRYQNGTVSHKVESLGSYWKITLTNIGLLDVLIIARIRPAATDVFGTYNPQIGSIIAWGAQLEAGSYATSYIPTTSASVTRNADVISKTGISSLIGQTEGTMFLDFNFNYSDSTTQVLLKVNQSNDSNSVGIEVQNNSLIALVNSSGSNIATLTNTISTGRIKCAIAYKSNDIVFYVNGSLVGTDTSGTINFGGNVDMLTLGHFNLLGSLFFQSSRPFNSVSIWKTRLTNTQLASLTTI